MLPYFSKNIFTFEKLKVFLISFPAPAPYSSILSISVKCVDFDSSLEYGEKKPFIPRYNLSCDSLHSLNDKRVYDSGIEPNQIVFTQWLPLPRDNHQLEMSRWFQTMLTVIQVEIEHDPQNPYRK